MSASAGRQAKGSCSPVTPPGAPIRGPARHATAAAAPNGTEKTKIARQSNSCVSAPPSAGPNAVATTAAPIHNRRADRSSAAITENAATSPAAPPSACTERAISRPVRSFALAAATEATANTTNPVAPIERAPRFVAARSSGISATARTIV